MTIILILAIVVLAYIIFAVVEQVAFNKPTMTKSEVAKKAIQRRYNKSLKVMLKERNIPYVEQYNIVYY